MEEDKGSLRDQIEQLNSNFESMVQKKETKRFKLPWAGRVGKRKVKEGYVSICYVNENHGVKFLKAPIKEGTIMVDGAPHIVSPQYILNYKNRPFVIVPSWNAEPFSPIKNVEEATKKETLTVGMRLLLNRLKSEQINAKKTINFGVIMIVLVVVGAGLYYLSQGGF